MEEVEDFEQACGNRLDSLGYELVDLGTDLDTNAHCFSIFLKSSGDLVSPQLLSISDVLTFIDSRASAGTVELQTKKAG